MKKLLFFALLGLATSCSSDRDVTVGERTTMEVESEFDAGDVLKGEKVEAEFIVKNTGKHPLVLGDVKPSCSCTVSEYTEDPILPGKQGSIKASIETEKFEAGLLYKTVNIVANTDPSTTVVTIKANVLENK